MFTMRFDMRLRDGMGTAPELYDASLEMAAWAEGKGCAAVQVSEHHASEDGYLPAPLVLATALAARTRALPIQVAALLVPLHDPIDLAEQMAVLDVISRGRVSYVCAIGYRPEEYAMFGREMAGRGRRMDACLEAMRRAWSGEAFRFEGREVRVTPTPVTPGGPALLMGGNSPAAVRRAARFGMGMITQGGDPELERIYREACSEAGHEPGLFINPTSDAPASCFVAEDPDRAWEQLGPYMLHDARMYAGWLSGSDAVTKSVASSVEELRAERGNYRIFTPDEAVEHVRRNGVLLLQPLCGGLPPALAWESLELVAGKVMPAVQEASG